MNRGLIVLCTAVLSLGPAACSDDHDGRDGDCSPAGQRVACSCDDGTDGSQVCLASGATTACDCRSVRTVPCSAPGVAFDCACAGGQAGMEICLADGRYTDCDCQAPTAAEMTADGGATGSSTESGNTEQPATCPEPLRCAEQMGVLLCVDASDFPPLCSSDADCASAGLPDGSCVDPMLGGVLICFQACEF